MLFEPYNSVWCQEAVQGAIILRTSIETYRINPGEKFSTSSECINISESPKSLSLLSANSSDDFLNLKPPDQDHAFFD